MAAAFLVAGLLSVPASGAPQPPGTQTTISTSLGLDLAEDSPKWCTYKGGTPTETPITPIDDDGDDPEDVAGRPCEIRRALELLRERAINGPEWAEEHGIDVEQLDAELERLGLVDCPKDDGDDPRDTSPPEDDGDDPRDVKLPCEELRAGLETALRSLKSYWDALAASPTSNTDDGSLTAAAVDQLDELLIVEGQIQTAIDELDETCPKDDDDPSDVGKPPCQELLAGLKSALRTLDSRDEALLDDPTSYRSPSRLRLTAEVTEQLADLYDIRVKIRTALEELESTCPKDDGDDPLDTLPPDDDGDDPRDVKPTCEELRAELEAARASMLSLEQEIFSDPNLETPEGNLTDEASARVDELSEIERQIGIALQDLGYVCPEDDGDDPRDVKPPCEEVLAALLRAEELIGSQLDAIRNSPTAHRRLRNELLDIGFKIQDAIRELERICPKDDGDDPSDVKPPCEELRPELETMLREVLEALEANPSENSAAELALFAAAQEKLDNFCPSDYDDPRDVGKSCAERIVDLKTELFGLVANLQFNWFVRESEVPLYYADIAEILSEIADLEDECGGDDPRDAPPPEEETPTEVVTITVVVKAKTSVLQDGSLVSIPKSGQMMKVIPSATTAMPLPGEGVTQEAALDSDRDPMQGRTNANGWLPFEIDLDPGEWPARYADQVRRRLELIAAVNDLNGLGERLGRLAEKVCARGLDAAGELLQRIGEGTARICTDPEQAAENICNRVSRGVDRLTAKARRLRDDPVACLGSGFENLADAALDVLDQITGVEFEANVNVEEETSVNVEFAGGEVDAAACGAPVEVPNLDALGPNVVAKTQTIGDRTWITLTFPTSHAAAVEEWIASTKSVVKVQDNFCRDKLAELNDPYMSSKGSWGQSWPDQWAIQRVGFTNDDESAWDLVGQNPQPVVVAVIDTGLDWHHLDIDWNNIWRNEGEVPDNGADDDGNGYVDDIIGWDFFANNNYPWDHDGHGTLVTGIIAAKQNNGHGIAGVNPYAKIMVLKGMNSFGHTRASYLAKAITYAADNGADVINMSVGGANQTDIEQAAIDYAYAKGVTIVVAAGNDAVDVSEWGTAGSEKVITVGATNRQDQRAVYSNHGRGVDLAAPGDDVMGLRARRTDTMRDIEGVEYEAGTAYVGEDKRYYRAGGTSFSAPIVSGVASLLLSKNPDLTPAQVKQILVQSAEDIEATGVDTLTGHGLVDARAALTADPDYRIEAMIEGLEVVQRGDRVMIQVNGTADADRLARAYVEIGEGEDPESWKTVINPVEGPVHSGSLGQFDAGHLAGSTIWMFRVVVRHENGTYRVHLFRLQTQ